nr:MAG TPA: Chromatin remodeling complex ATPase [Caudoviricetes sp.]
MKTLQLRPYQLDAIERLRDGIRAGHKNQLLCSATGSGKSVIAASLLDECAKKGNRAVFVCDRLSLINQTSALLDSYGIAHGVIQAQHPRWRPYERIQVCSAQTLARRQWPDADLIVIDECHTITETVKNRISARNTIAIGLTATPFTKGLGKLYDNLVNVTSTQALIDEGFLSGYRIFACKEPDMEGVRVVAGEWEEKETSRRALEVVGDCVKEYVEHCNGKKFICSAVNTAHVEELQRQFMAAGILCANYTYKTSEEEREAIVNEFKKPDSVYRGLITVTAASKGFDQPDVECIIMARPLRNSLAEHIQLFGRGLRIHPDKKECIVLDHSGNCLRFMDEMQDFFQNGATELDDGKQKNRKKKKTEDIEDKYTKCPVCKALHASALFCPNCGHEYPPKKSEIIHKAGTLKELIASGTRQELTVELWPQIVRYSLEHKTPEKAEKFALAMFRNITGTWPLKKFYDTAPSEIITDYVRRKIKSLNIRYAKATQARERSAA